MITGSYDLKVKPELISEILLEFITGSLISSQTKSHKRKSYMMDQDIATDTETDVQLQL